jgi:hypothetical protein
VLITVGGVVQPTPESYTVSGSTIVFTGAPPLGASFYGVCYNGEVASAPPVRGFNAKKIDDISILFDGVQTVFNLSSGGIPIDPPFSYTCMIALGGLVQPAIEAYNISGGKIAFTQAPATNTAFYGVFLG